MTKKKDTMGSGTLRPSIASAQAKKEPAEEEKKEKKRIAIRSPFRWSNRPEWLTTFFAAIAVGLFAYLMYFGIQTIQDTLNQNQQHQTIATVWRQLLSADVNVIGTPTDLDEKGDPSFSAISFHHTRSKRDLHRNLRLAAALPGIRNIDLAPEVAREIGTGFADDTTLEVVATYFTDLDSLDLSSTKVTTLQPIADIAVRQLKIINAPIRREKLASLQLCTAVTDLWVGWHNDARRDNADYVSEGYKERMLDVVSKMTNVRNLYIYEMVLTPEQQEVLPPRIKVIEIK